jgi:multiple sugar transport system substrate-binding protein
MVKNDVSEQALTKARDRIPRIAAFILIFLAGCIVATCGPTKPSAPSVATGPTATVTVPFDMPVTIAIAGRFGEQALAVLDTQIARFEAANPDITVEVIRASSSPAQSRQEFITSLETADARIDVYLLQDTWLTEFATNGWLLALDDYARSWEIEIDAFLPSTVEASTIDGQLWALPWAADGGMLYYRQDLLDKQGYIPPTTWADLQAIALEIQAREKLPHGFVWQGAANESLTCNTLEFVWASGGEVLDDTGNVTFDSPETRSALQQMSDLVTSGTSPPDITSYSESKALTAFQNGEAIFMRNWSFAWALLNQTDGLLAGQVGLAPLPTSCLFGQSLALSVHSSYSEQAFRFMAFLTSYEQQLQILLQGGQLPALETVYHDDKVLSEAPSLRDLRAALSVTRPRPQSPAYLQLSEAIYTEVNTMLHGEQTVATTAATVQERIEAIIR